MSLLCPFKLNTKGTANKILGPSGKPSDSYNPNCEGERCAIFIVMRESGTNKVVESGCAIAIQIPMIHRTTTLMEAQTQTLLRAQAASEAFQARVQAQQQAALDAVEAENNKQG